MFWLANQNRELGSRTNLFDEINLIRDQRLFLKDVVKKACPNHNPHKLEEKVSARKPVRPGKAKK